MDFPSLCSSECFYRSSGKKYPDLIPYILNPKVCELWLNPKALLGASSHNDISIPLKEQMLFLVAEIQRVHQSSSNNKVLSPSLFLKKKSSGFFRLDHAAQMGFYKEGVLEVSIAGNKEGILYVYTPEHKMHLNYVEFYYYFGTCN